MTVVVGIPTFKRPEGLRRTLRSLSEQLGSERLLVLIVDNDPAGSGGQVAAAVPELRVKYLHQTRPGVVAVRNLLLKEAAHATFLIFVDDDQTVGPGWLAALLTMHARYPTDVLAGPVDYVVDGRPLEDPLLSAVFHRAERADGSTLPSTGTGNSLVPIHALAGMAYPFFDERFSSCGGEDTDFFGRFVDAGGTIRWCSEARVSEHVPSSRATRTEALRRVRRAGYVNGLLALDERTRAAVLLGAILRVIAGSSLALLRPGSDASVRGTVRLHGGLGRTRAALGRGLTYYGGGTRC